MSFLQQLVLKKQRQKLLKQNHVVMLQKRPHVLVLLMQKNAMKQNPALPRNNLESVLSSLHITMTELILSHK